MVAASWVAGRRRVTREGTEREGRECRRKGDGGIEVEIETAVMDVDTSEDSSLRSLIGDEAGGIGSQGEGDLAPPAPNHAGRLGGWNVTTNVTQYREHSTANTVLHWNAT